MIAVCLGALVLLGGFRSALAFQIDRVSSPVLYIDTTEGLTCAYAAYRVINDTGTSQNDVWFLVDNFSGAVIGTAPTEDGWYKLGAMAPGDTAFAYVYLTASAEILTPQTHTATVYDARTAGNVLATANFSLTSMETIKASSNKVTSTLFGPNPPGLGGIMILTVQGETGTVGGAGIFAASPASYPGWEADAFRLVNVEMVMTGSPNAGTYRDSLFWTLPDAGNTAYTITYTFVVSAVTTSPTVSGPVNYISSGSQIKHTTNVGDPAIVQPVQPVTNAVTLTKRVSPASMIGAGTVTYSVTLHNADTIDVDVEYVEDLLPVLPDTALYVPGSAMFQAGSIPDPGISGQLLTFVGPFAVAGLDSAVLSYQVQMPSTAGVYSNRAVGVIGDEQIDTTVDTNDDVPAVADFVSSPPNPRIGAAKAVTAGPVNNGNGSFTLTYTLAVGNYGDVVLDAVQLSDDLGAVFAAADSFRVDSVTSARFAVNGAYSGSNPDTLLLAGTDTLDVAESGTVDVTVTVWPGFTAGPYANRAVARGQDFLATVVTDASVPGGNPDPDGNGDPGDNTGTTDVTFAGTASVGAAKAVTAGPVNNGDGSFTLTYSLTVQNYGDLRLRSLQLTDDLSAAFAAADSFRVDSVTSLVFTVNGAYSGAAPDTLLLAGTDTLNIGGVGTVAVTVTVWPGFTAGPYANRAFVRGTDFSNSVAGDASVAGVNPDLNGNGNPADDTGTTDVTFSGTPSVGVAKAVTAGPVNNGDGSHTLAYTFTVENYGDVALRSLQVSDDLAAAFAGVDSFQVGSLSSATLGINGAFTGTSSDTLLLAGTDTLGIGETATVNLTLTVWPGFSGGPHANRAFASAQDFAATVVTDASVDGTNPDLNGNGNPGDDTGTTDVTFTGSPSVGVAKAVTAGPVNNGDGSHTLSYTLSVENFGDVPLRNLQVSDDLAAAFAAADSFRVDSATSAAFTVNGAYTGTGPDTLLLAGTDILGIGGTGTVSVTVTVWPGFTPGPYANRAFVQGEDLVGTVVRDGSVNGTDPDPNGNGDPADDSGTTDVTFSGTPAIGVAKGVTAGPVNNGDGSHGLTYTLTVRNYGNLALGSLQVSDDLAAVFAGADSFRVDAVTSAAFTVNGAYTGTGPDTLLLAGTDILLTGATGTVAVSVTVWPGLNAGPYGNRAFARGQDFLGTVVTDESVAGANPDPNGNGDPTDDGGTTPVTFGGSPRVGAAKAVTAGPSSNGDGSFTLAYTLAVGNYGDVALQAVQVSDDLGAAFAAADSFRVDSVTGAGLAVNGAYTGTSPDTLLLAGTDVLNVGQSRTVTVTLTVWPGLVSGYANRAFASALDPILNAVTDASVNGSNPDANGNGDPGDDQGPTPISFSGTPRIGAAKAVVSGPVNNGDGSHTLAYSLLVRNYGDVSLGAVQVSDDLGAAFAAADSFRVDSVTSAAFTVNGAYTGTGPDTLLLAGADALAPGASGTVQVTVTVWPGFNAGPYGNRAVAAGTDLTSTTVSDVSVNGADPDPNGNGDPTDDAGTTDVTFTGTPVIGAAKAVASGPVNNGDGSHTLTYSLLARNYGDVALQNVQISDDLSAAFAAADSFRVDSVTSGTLSVNGAYTGTGPDTLLLSGSDVLGIGQSGTVAVTVTVWPGTTPGPYGNRAFARGEDFASVVVADASVPGGDPDANGNGNPGDDAGTTDITFTGTPLIGAAKAVVGGPVNNGDGSLTLTYSVLVRNYGNLTLQNVQVSDDLGTTFAGADSFRVDAATSGALTVNGAYTGTNPDTLLLTGADALVPGASGTVQVTVTVWPGFNPGPYGNRAFARGTDWVGTTVTDGSVSGTDPDPNGNGNPGDDEGTTTITFGGTPLLGAAKRVASGPVNNGDGSHSLTYSLLVRNYGDLSLRGLQLSDDLAAAFAGADSFRVTSVTSGALSVNGAFTGTGPDTLLLAGTDTLFVGASATMTVAVTVWPGLDAGPYANRAFASGQDFTAATVTDASVDGANPDPDGNGDPTDNQSPTNVSFSGTARLGVAKAVTAGPVNNGDGSHTVTYTLNVENYGDLPLQNLQVTDDLAAAFAGVDSVQVNLVSAAGLTVNTGYTGSAPDTALLAGTDVLGIGESASITLAITVWPGFALGPHGNRAFARAVDLVGGAVNDASVDGTNPDANGNGDPADDTGATPVTFTGTPVIGLAKAVTAGPVNNGDGSHTLTYTLTVRNYGNVPLLGIAVGDNLGTTFATADSFRVDAVTSPMLTVNPAFTGTAPDTLLLAGTDSLVIQAGTTVDVTVTVWPGLNPGPYANVASAAGADQLAVIARDGSTAGTDPDANGNGDPRDDDSPTTVTFGGSAVIGLAKAVSSGPIDNGDGSHSVSYLLTVRNFGDLSLQNLQISDDLGTTFAGADSFRVTGLSGSGLTLDPSFTGIAPDTTLLSGTDMLAIGETRTATVSVVLWPGFNPGPYQNQAYTAAVDFLGNPVTDASTSGTNPDADGNGDPGDDVAPTPVMLNIASAPEILLTKTAQVERATVGDIVPYRIDIRRVDDGPAVDVTLDDLIPAGFTLVEDSGRLVRPGPDGSLGTADDSVSTVPVTGGRPVSFGPAPVGRFETVRLTYFLRVGAGAAPGSYENRATAYVDGDPAGNTASAVVTVTADPIMGTTTVLGKVWNDQDRDGFQDRGQAHGVRIGISRAGRGDILNATLIDETGSRLIAVQSLVAGFDLGEFPAKNAIGAEPRTVRLRLELSGDAFPAVSLASDEGTNLRMEPDGKLVDARGDAVRQKNSDQHLTLTRRILPGARGPVVEFTVTNEGVDEQGIPGVRLATADGLVITTDADGRYHLADIDAGRWELGRNFILKVDPSSLPPGSEFTTENPRVLHITSTVMNRMSFGVHLPEGRSALPSEPDEAALTLSASVQPGTVVSLLSPGHADTLTLSHVTFASGKADLQPAARSIVSEAAKRLRSMPKATARIEGHTDYRPISNAEFANNYELSGARAAAVMRELEKRYGIDRSRMLAVGYGPDRPLTLGRTAEDLQRNRRVEIVIYAQGLGGGEWVGTEPEAVTYSLRYAYSAQVPLETLGAEVLLPQGTEYAAGSSELDDAAVDDPQVVVADDGARLRWALPGTGTKPQGVLTFKARLTTKPQTGLAAHARLVWTTVRGGAGVTALVDAPFTVVTRVKDFDLARNVSTAPGPEQSTRAVVREWPAAPGAAAAAGRIRVVLEDGFFQPGGDRIRPENTQALDTIAGRIRSHERTVIVIEPGTDAALADRRRDRLTETLSGVLGPDMRRVEIRVRPRDTDSGSLWIEAPNGGIGQNDSPGGGFGNGVKNALHAVAGFFVGAAYADTPDSTTASAKGAYRIEVLEDKGPTGDVSTLRLPDGGVLWVVPEPGRTEPRLDVRGPEEAYVNGRGLAAPVSFGVYCNYPAFIASWQLVVYDAADEAMQNPVAVLGGDGFPQNPVVTWPGDGKRKDGDALVYVLRVSDAAGHTDETLPRTLNLFTDRGLSADRNAAGEVHGQSNLARQTIPIRGGFVRVHGAGLGTSRITVEGMEQPVDAGAFACERLVPYGPHRLAVEVTSPAGDTWEGTLGVDIPESSLFLVGMANVTVGKNTVSGNPQITSGDPHYDGNVFTDGRLAFYLKGLAKGRYHVTAQLDSREEALKDFFRHLDRKDPRTLFRRLDPDLYYTNYGDGSVTVPDVDTQGRFYARLEWDKSQLLWGNYDTGLTGTEYGQFNRSLYGASLKQRTMAATRYGDPRAAVTGFASEAQSAFAHQEFLGTGGSLYYLRYTDIVQGSEKLWVEVRDRDSDRTVQNVALRRGQDYEIDEIQGRILLTRPLMQVADQAAPSIIKDQPLDGNRVLLMADYEYVPEGFSGTDMTAGGRARVWPADALGVGGTYVSEQRDGRDYTLRGGDVVLRGGTSTFLKVEAARSEEAQTLTRFYSDDGGLTVTDTAPVTALNTDGEAYSVEARYGEATGGPRPVAEAWWKKRTAGFSTARLSTGIQTIDYGAELQWGNGGPWTLSGRMAVQDRDTLGKDRKVTAQGRYRLNARWNVSGELRQVHTKPDTAAAVDALLAGLRVGYAPIPAMEVYLAGQGAVNSDSAYADNALATLGLRARFSPRIGVRVEGSAGDRGQSARAGANFALNDDHEVYGTYTLSSDRMDGPQGTATVGQRKRLSRQVDVFTEDQFTHGERQAGLSQTYGLNFNPREAFSTSLTFQRSNLKNRTAGDVDRDAVSLAATYRGEHGRYSAKGEYRNDTGAVDVRQWVTANRGDFTITPALTLIGKFNYSYSKNLTTSSTDARFMETGLGLAYRALSDDRLNLLAKHTYLFDIPSPSQATERPAQRSHVISAEALYLVLPRLEAGVHYAHRMGEVRLSRESGDWVESRANLAAVRGRYHLIRQWDAMAEYRWLWVTEAKDMKQGLLAGVYRHLGDHMKLGVGYNFTNFSDDLTDLGYDSKGWFVTAVGKY